MDDPRVAAILEAMAEAIWTTYTNSQVPPEDLRGITWEELCRWAKQKPRLQEVVDLCFAEARAALTAALAVTEVEAEAKSAKTNRLIAFAVNAQPFI
jgi:hypothetical protein